MDAAFSYRSIGHEVLMRKRYPFQGSLVDLWKKFDADFDRIVRENDRSPVIWPNLSCTNVKVFASEKVLGLLNVSLPPHLNVIHDLQEFCEVRIDQFSAKLSR